MAQETVVEVLEVVQPLAQIGIAGLADAGAMFRAHPLDRRFRRQAGMDRVVQRLVPAAAMGQHLVGFEHLEGGALRGVVALQDTVDLLAQPVDRLAQPGLFGLGIV